MQERCRPHGGALTHSRHRCLWVIAMSILSIFPACDSDLAVGWLVRFDLMCRP